MKNITLLLVALLISVFIIMPGRSNAQSAGLARALAADSAKHQKNYQLARFEGGDAALRSYILNHLLIKPNAQTDHEAIIQFDVSEEGDLTNFRVDGNISMQLTMDLKNVMKGMRLKMRPMPATLNGKPVKSEYSLTIKFG
jgi:hypothetical protein